MQAGTCSRTLIAPTPRASQGTAAANASGYPNQSSQANTDRELPTTKSSSVSPAPPQPHMRAHL